MYLTDKPEKCRRASALAWLDSFTGFSRMQKLNSLPLLRHARTHARTHSPTHAESRGEKCTAQ